MLEEKYKNSIVKNIIKYISPNINYYPKKRIDINKILNSKLFNKFDKYYGEDFITGKINGVKLEASDIKLIRIKKNKVSINGKTTYQKNSETIFYGTFITAKMNKSFNSITLVYPDIAQKFLGKLLGQSIQSIISKSNLSLINMDSPEFEKEFKVYSNNKIDSMYILTHNIMENILDIRKKLNKNIYVSFINNRVYIGIELLNMFTLNIDKTVNYDKIFNELFYTLNATVGIVENLNLDRKIFGNVN